MFLTVLPFSETWVDAIVHQVLADQAVWVRSLGAAFGPSGQIISGEHEVIVIYCGVPEMEGFYKQDPFPY